MVNVDNAEMSASPKLMAQDVQQIEAWADDWCACPSHAHRTICWRRQAVAPWHPQAFYGTTTTWTS